ncbi:MAG: sugar phosphate isomerase/epimerase [Clostridia bacterium]|nr:sugar phosphate isomerase/epimerase [Clostridia bacterium]
MIRLCAFADEAGTSLAEQIAALKQNNISLIELRSIDEKNVSKFTDEEAAEYARILRENGIAVWSVGSPLGKVELAEAEEHMATVRRVCEIAKILGAQRVRMFSFYNSEGQGEAVIAALRKMAGIAEEYGLIFCHENEKGIYGDTDGHVEELMNADISGLRFVFDPANFIQCGVSVRCAAERLFSRTDYLHVKDVVAATGELVPAGHGDGFIDGLINMITASGGDFVLTLEPHLMIFAGYNEIDGEEMKHRFHFTSNADSFAFAANALKEILIKCGYNETEKGWIYK